VPGSHSREEVTVVGLVTGGHFLSHFYLLAFPPLFPLLRAEFGLSNARLGLLVSVISAAMLLQALVGELVDRAGAKRVFVAGVAATAAGVLLTGTADSYPALLAFAALSGVGQAAFHPADYPLVEAVSDADREGRNFSVHTFGGYAGFAVAPLVVGRLGLARGWRTALLAVGAAGLAYAVLAAVALPPAYRAQVEARADAGDRGDAADGGDGGTEAGGDGSGATPTDDGTADLPTADGGGDADADGDDDADGGAGDSLTALLRPGIAVMALFFVVFSMAGKGVQSFTPVLAVDGFGLAESVGNTALSGFFAVTAAAVLAGGPLADRYDPRRVIAAATATAAGTLAVVVSGVGVDATGLVVAFGVAGGAYGLVFASRDRLVSSSAAAGSTGRSFGLVFTASSLGSLASPVLLGVVIDAATAGAAFAVVAGFFLLAGGVALLAGRPSALPGAAPSRSD